MGNYDGTVYTRETFKKHLDSIPASELKWIKFGCIHNTGAPNMAQQRVTKGGASARMRNAKPDADKRLGGKGAHYWCFETGEIGKSCPLPQQGAHSAGWNQLAFGIEQVADFRDKIDDPKGAGKPIVDTAAWVFAQILKKVGLPANDTTIKMHKENHTAANTTHHDCPGNRFDKADFVRQVQSYMGVEAHEAPAPIAPEAPKPVVATATVGSILDIQTLLKAAGFPPGPLDGQWGPKTKASVKAYQTSKGLVSDGVVGPITWASLTTPVLTSTEKLGVKPPVALPLPPAPPAPEAPKPVEVVGLQPIEDLHPSDFCLSWAKRFEGLMLKAYDDVGSWAIGYGHNANSKREPIPYEGMTITEAQAIEILHNDLEAIGKEVKKVLKGYKVNQDQFDALVLDCFQRGQTQFTKTPVVKAIKEGGDANKAINDQAIHKNAGVARRRKVQALIFAGERPTKW